MELLYILLVILVVARAFAELAVRIGQPSLVGEIVAGILLGLLLKHYSGALPALESLTEDRVFIAITDLGIFFLMLLGGLELRPKAIAGASKGAATVAVSAMVLPFFAGLAVAWLYLPESEYKIAQAVFVGTGLAITAVPIAVKVLMDFGKLDSPMGRTVISAAIIDDVISLVLLAMLTALIKTGALPSASEILLLMGEIALFFAAVTVVGLFILPKLAKLIMRRFKVDELEFSFLVVVALLFSVLAEELSMHFILGAFVAGLFFSKRTLDEGVYEDVKKKTSAITTGFLAPIFFASIGLHLDLGAVGGIPGFLALLIFIAFASKLVGAYVPAKMIGFPRREALSIGVAMSARGAVELVIAGIALRWGLFTKPEPRPPIVEYMFSAIVIVAIVTTLVVPVALRPLLREQGASGGNPARADEPT
jgi:Kef-type K+ transport system membrane component KefB